MSPVILENETLGEKHRHFNKLIEDAIADKRYELHNIRADDSDIDKLLKINIASKTRNVDYIIEVMKSNDMLYAATAIKKSTWMITEQQYAHIINPEYLHTQLLPSMNPKSFNKLMLHIRLNLKDETRVEAFYEYLKETGYQVEKINQSMRTYQWYEFCPFDVAMPELTKLLRTEKSFRERCCILSILITCAKRNPQHVKTLLKFVKDKHINEPFQFKIQFVNNLLSEIPTHEFDFETWNALDQLFRSIDVYSELDNNVQHCLQSIVLYKVLRDEPVPEIVEQKITFDTFENIQKKLDEAQNDRIFTYLLNSVLAKVQNQIYADESNFKETLVHLKNALCLLKDWKKDITKYPFILEKIRELIKTKQNNMWETDLSCFYNIQKSWRKYIFEESLSLSLCEETCLNALKHKPQLLMQHDKEIDTLRTNDAVSLRRLLTKLRVYWPDTLAQHWTHTYLLNLCKPAGHKATIKGLFILLRQNQITDIARKYAPDDYKINWSKTNEVDLSIQKSIAQYLHLARPLVCLDTVLLYAKGDYLQYAVPSLNAVMLNLNETETRKCLYKLLDAPVSLRKYGVNLALSKLKSDDLKPILLIMWNTSNNLTIRSALFKHIHSQICKTKDITVAKELWDILSIFMDDLTADESSDIYKQIGNVQNVPINIRAEFYMKSYEFLTSLPASTNCDGYPIRMPPLTLEGDTLGEKRRHINKLVEDTIANKDYELHNIRVDDSDIDNLLKIGIACKTRNIDYIIEVMKSNDMLYAATAIKKSTWLITEQQYAHIINPEYLHTQLLPSMNPKSFNKLMLHIRLNLKDETRVEAFYDYLKGNENAYKWLQNCSIPFIKNVIQNERLIPLSLFKRLCRRSPEFIPFYTRVIQGRVTHASKQEIMCYVKSHTDYVLDVMLHDEMYFYCSPTFSEKNTKFLMKSCPQKVFDNFDKFIKEINLSVTARYLKKKEIKTFLKQKISNSNRYYLFIQNQLIHFIKNMPENDRFDFVKQTFIDKTKLTAMYPEKESMYLFAKFYKWYEFAPFNVALPELKKLIQKEKSSSERCAILSVLITCARKNPHHVKTLLKLVKDEHMNESKNVKITFVNNLLSLTPINKFDAETWDVLDQLFHSIKLYTDSNNNVQLCLQSIVLYKILHDEPVPEIVEQKIIFDTFEKFQRKLDERQNNKIFTYLLNSVLNKIQNQNCMDETNFNEIVVNLKNALNLLKDWKKDIRKYPFILEKIQELIKVKQDNMWKIDLSCLYNIKKSWRKHMFEESLSLSLCEETCLNALKHKPQLLMQHDKEVDTLRTNDAVSLRRLLAKLRVYWSHSYAQHWIQAFLFNLSIPARHKAAIKGLFILYPQNEIIDMATKYAPENFKINRSKMEQGDLFFSIQKYIAENLHIARPLVSLDTVLLYAKGNHLQYAVPSLNAIMDNMSEIRTAAFFLEHNIKPVLITMPPVTLEGDTLGEKHRHFNKLVVDAIADKRYELRNIRADDSDIDNLLKIDVASKTRNVDYIIEVMKSNDLLYAATAIKKSTWLITEQQYAHIINPEYLHTQLLPSMNPKSFNKLMLHIRLNLKDETRVEAFYEYLKETDSAYKWLEHCSIPFIENVLKNGRLIPLSLYKRLCKRSAHFLAYYESVESRHMYEVKQAILLLLKSHTTEVLDVLEDKKKHGYIPPMGKKKTKILMKKCTTRVLDNFDKYADIIDLSMVAKYIQKNEIKAFLCKHGSKLLRFNFFDTLKNFIKNMPAEERFEFVQITFLDKTEMALIFSDSERSRIERCVNTYQWYEFAPFDVAFPEMKTLIRRENSSSKRCAMLSVLITCTQNKLQDIRTLLIFYNEKHINEPLNFKIRFVNNLLYHISTHEFDAETWNILDQLFHSMDVYTEPNYSVQHCLYSIVAYKVLHDEPVPEVVEQNMTYDSFEQVQSKLNQEQKNKLFTYLFNFMLSKIQSNEDISNEGDAQDNLLHLENTIRLLRDWNKNICDFPVILEEIQKFIQIVHQHMWQTDMSYLYNIQKSWRKHMFEESLSLNLGEETCLNALKHKPQLLMQHDKEVDTLRTNDAVSLRRLLAKLRVYWPDTLAQHWTDAYLHKLHTGQKAILKGLFMLLSQNQIVDLAKKHAPDNFQVTWGETDQTELKIRKNIAKNLHVFRPLIPLDAVLCSMPPVTLEGDTLGEKHRHFNKLVEDAIVDKHYELRNIRADDGDIDNLLKINIASKTRNVDYIIEVMKSNDMLYAATAIKKSTWLITEQQYAHIINPEYLHTQLLPSMNPKSFNKLMLHIRLNLKDETRVEAFYEYLKESDSAYKWNDITNESDAKDNLLHLEHTIILLRDWNKNLCEFPVILEEIQKFIQIVHQNMWQMNMSNLYNIKKSWRKHMLEESLSLSLCEETCLNALKHKPQLLMQHDKEVDTLRTNDAVSLRRLLTKLRVYWPDTLAQHWTDAYLHKLHTGQKAVLKGLFMLLSQKQIVDLAKKYAPDNFRITGGETDQTELKIRKKIAKNLHVSRPLIPLDVVLWYAKGDYLQYAVPSLNAVLYYMSEVESLEHLPKLLDGSLITMPQVTLEGDTLGEKHRHFNKLVEDAIADKHYELCNIRTDDSDIDNLLKINIASKTSNVDYIIEVMKSNDMLYAATAIKKSTWLITEQQYAHIINPEYLHTQLLPSMNPKSFNKLMKHIRLNLKDETRVEAFYEYLKETDSAYKCKVISNKIDAKDNLLHLERVIILLRDWNKNLCEFPVILEEIQKLIQTVHQNMWQMNMSNLYDIKKSWRKHMLEESLLLSLCEETCLNALKHKPQLLMQHDKEIDTLRTNDAVSLRRLLTKLRVYWPDTLAQQWTDAYLHKLHTGQKAILKGLFMLLSQKQIVDLAKKHAPDNFQITMGETDQTVLKIRKNIAKNLHVSRPLIPLDAILWYAKGDYLQYAVPSLNAILYYMSEVESSEHLPKLLDASVSLPKFALNLTFNKLKSDVLKSVFLETWKMTKNLTIRSVLFKHTVDRICKLTTMPRVTLEGDTLGEKHRHFNKLVKNAIADQRYELRNIREDDSEIDNLLKINIASRTRNVDYIIEVMKSNDMLYAATAIKKSTWLITEQQYAHIINPEYLHTQLLPSMNPKSFNKLMLHIRLNLKDETRVEAFYEYLKETDSAYKWLEHCSIPFIENVLKNGRLIPLSLYKRLCKRSAHFLAYYGSVESHYMYEVKQAVLLLLKSHTTEVLNLVEEKTKLDYIPRMGKKKTKFLMKKCTPRLLDNFDKYADKIDLSMAAKYLKKNEIKAFLYKHREKLLSQQEHSALLGSHFFDQNILNNFIKTMPTEDRFEFTKRTFSDKTKIALFSDQVSYQWYKVAPFDVAFTEIKTLICKEALPSERYAMLSVLITCTQNKLKDIKTLLTFYNEKHINEPLEFKVQFINNLLSKVSTHEFDAETWNILDQLFISIDVYTKPNYDVQRCLYSIVTYKILHDEPVPQIVEQNISFNSLKDLQNKLNQEQSNKLFTYLFNFTLSKIQNKDITNECDAEDNLFHLENTIKLLRDWNKSICEFPVILEEIQKFIQIVHQNMWQTNMSNFYNIKKSWRKHMLEESLSLSLCEETCLNALKHKPQLLMQHDKEVDTLRTNDAVSLRRLLAKLRIYWPDTLAQHWTDAYLHKLHTGQKAILKGLFMLLSQKQIVDLAKKHAPDNFQITWTETDQTLLKIRKNIAKKLHVSRPLIPLDAVLWYAKGDYLQYAVPSLNAVLYYMTEVGSLEHLPKLLDGSVTLQRFGLNITFKKLKSVSTETWKTTKNLTIRSILFKLIVDQICKVDA
ncbi:hypothetical protein PYW08_008261 [Mythimna loreyi]|uniref:Uncharacterized protein n=1 Tax=Mythimna loreyi TaxID=667449 RepID=A0ACC2QCX3_9NEOP|nr:hypothetical protein PYW08_008261 [Mythimna loreyi]